VSEIEESIVDIDTRMEPWYGDALEPLQLIEGKGIITRSFDSILTDDTLAKFRKAVWNSATPAAGTRPVKDVFFASATQVFTRSATRSATIATPRVAVDPANFEAMGPQPEGGPKPLRLGGQCQKSGATPPITVTVLSADATTYA
jgi:hypothetical protein